MRRVEMRVSQLLIVKCFPLSRQETIFIVYGEVILNIKAFLVSRIIVRIMYVASVQFHSFGELRKERENSFQQELLRITL